MTRVSRDSVVCLVSLHSFRAAPLGFSQAVSPSVRPSLSPMSAAVVEMAAAAVAGDEQAEWMMGGGGDADGDDRAADRLAERARSVKQQQQHQYQQQQQQQRQRAAAGGEMDGAAALADSATDASDAQLHSDAASVGRTDWTALISAALAEAAHEGDTDSALPALSALSSALSDLDESNNPASNAASGSPSGASNVHSSAAPTSDSSALLGAVWPFLPSFYSALRLSPSSSRHVAVVRAVVDVVALLCHTFPAALLLARLELGEADSTGAAHSSAPPPARHPCVWSALLSAVEARLSDVVSPASASAGLSCSALCQLLRCCASLLPSTLSVLSVYGDVVGCVLPALLRVTDRVRAVLVDPASPALLVQYAAGAARCVLLTHTPIDVVDGMSPLLPASLSLSSSSSSSSSSASRSSAVVPSSSSLSSFPVLSSESSLYFPTVSPFDLRLVPDSHPDLDARQLRDIALGLLTQLIDSVQQCTAVSPSVSVHVELLLFVVRQRSVAYAALCLPALLRFAAQLLSLPPSPLASGALQSVRLGLFALFRLSSCAAYWPGMLSVLSQPASSILAMEAQRINKQRSHATLSLSTAQHTAEQRNQQPSLQLQQQQQQQQIAGSLHGQPVASSPVDGALPALREVVSVRCTVTPATAVGRPVPATAARVRSYLEVAPHSAAVVVGPAAAAAASAHSGAGRHQAAQLEVSGCSARSRGPQAHSGVTGSLAARRRQQSIIAHRSSARHSASLRLCAVLAVASVLCAHSVHRCRAGGRTAHTDCASGRPAAEPHCGGRAGRH